MNAKTRYRLNIAAALAVTAAVCIGVVALRAPYETPYSRGKKLVQDMGCISCHSAGKSDLTPNPSADITVPDGEVPALVGSELTTEDFLDWVLDGSKRGLADSDRWRRQTSARAIGMPAYREHLSTEQVLDIKAWAMIEGHEPASTSANEEDRWSRAEALADDMGCFACHGPLGQGGSSNPGSFTSQIPALMGEEFAHLSNGAEKAAIREWIRDGASERFLADDPLAFLGKRFMTEQRAQMPAFGGVLSTEQIDLLVDYCLHLYELGPLGHEEYASYRAGRQKIPAQAAEVKDPNPLPLETLMPEAVEQILSRACLRCHGEKKQKSGYRMDSRAAAFSSGEISAYLEAPAISPGDPEGSLLLKFVLAEEELAEEEIFPMPPDEKDRLSEDEINTIKTWIASGAPWGESQVLQNTHPN